MMKLLIVEDNIGDARLIEELLEESDVFFQAKHAQTVAEALQLLGDVELILLDLGLPDSMGLDTYRKFADVAIPVVILTGNNDRDIGLQAIKLGAQDYVPKSEMTGQLLSRTLMYAIERHRHDQQDLQNMAGLIEKLKSIAKSLQINPLEDS